MVDLPEILDCILTYALSFDNLIDLTLVCKAWRVSIRNIVGLAKHEPTSITNLVKHLISISRNDIVLLLVYDYIRNRPIKSPLFLLDYAMSENNNVVSSYIRSNHIYSFDSLIGWTIISYIKHYQLKELKDIRDKVSRYVQQDKVKLIMSICKPSPTKLYHRPRTIIIIKEDKESLIYRILECWSLSLEEAGYPLREPIEQVHCIERNRNMGHLDTVKLFHSSGEYGKLKIFTKTKEFSIGLFDVWD